MRFPCGDGTHRGPSLSDGLCFCPLFLFSVRGNGLFSYLFPENHLSVFCMDIEKLREFCLSLPQTEECFPFGEDYLVFKVSGKMFLLTSLAGYRWINLKCDPAEAEELRERYPEVTPGYHMNKRHWNSVEPESGLDDGLIERWIVRSYLLAAGSLPRRVRDGIPGLDSLREKYGRD